MLPAGLVCPVCHGALSERDSDIFCDRCERAYPVVAGIPDLRIAPDPWIDLEADRAKALRVLEEAEGLDFEGHVRAYWGLTPETAPHHAERFVQHVLTAARRSREWLSLFPAPAHDTGLPWLDLGCGTADLAEASPGTDVVGVDVAMRWLVIAQRRLLDRGLRAHLVCANAEALPFRMKSFSAVLSLGMIEHSADHELVAQQARRVLTPGGEFRLRTTNRFSLMPEPHVGLWGVGFLPRAWADAYVRGRGGQGYTHHHPPSARSLRRALESAGFVAVAVEAAPTLPTEISAGGKALRMMAPLYRTARRVPVAGSLLRTVAPLLEAAGTVAEDE